MSLYSFGGINRRQLMLGLDIMDSPAVAEAMESDGVKRDTVKVFVLDKEFKF